MRRLWMLLLCCYPLLARGHGEVEDLSELALLPSYCRGAQQIRVISNDPKTLEEYVALYGESYMHIQHYCWALNSENKLTRIRDDHLRDSELLSILHNIQYTLDRSASNFTLLPDIYLSKARVLFKMERDVEAIGVLFKLTQLRPDYGPTYDQLGEYYQRIGDKSSAIRYFEQGLINSNAANRAFFLKKIRALDKKYQAPALAEKPASPASAEDNPTPPAAAVSTTVEATEEPAVKPNPYCRFCP